MGTALLAHMGGAHLFIFFPFAVLGAAGFFIFTALRDGSEKNTSTRTLPTSPFSRQLHAALRPQRPERSTAQTDDGKRPAPAPERFSRRHGSSPFQVMEGEAGEGNRPRIPQRFEPAPPTRRRA